jgi:RimJ/RimL family protein N-acetyltransferase
VAGLTVRPARPGDASALVALARAVGAEPGGWLLSTDDWRDVGTERRLLRTLRNHPDAQVFVAEVPKVIVGRLSIGRDTHPASRHVADLGLMVAASHRRQGVGTRLLEEAVGWARRSGVRKLELHVLPHNAPAIALYERFGFTREGYRHGHYRRENTYLDAVLMAFEVDGHGR